MSLGFALLIIGAYLLGAVPAAYLVARWRRGIDIRKYGSGNVGASNILRTVSKRWSIPVALFDIGKGVLMVWIAQLIGLGAAEQITVGIVTIIGHNWPVSLHFKGGRGIFTSLGVITILSPLLGLIVLVMAYILAPLRQMALGVFCALISLPIFSWFLSGQLGIAAADRLAITIGLIVLTTVGLTRRLLEPRTELSRSQPLAKVLLTRLVFDRDIMDRKAWVYRTPIKKSPKPQPPQED